MCQRQTTISHFSVRKVLLAIHPNGLNQRLLEYTGNLCQRIGADVDVLWFETATEIPPLLQTFMYRCQQEQIACQLLHCSGCMHHVVIQQVTLDRRITVVVINSLKELDKLPRGDSISWWTQLPCPLVVVNYKDEHAL
jgi:hypothetical protein